jgi:hypothetical protein
MCCQIKQICRVPQLQLMPVLTDYKLRDGTELTAPQMHVYAAAGAHSVQLFSLNSVLHTSCMHAGMHMLAAA